MELEGLKSGINDISGFSLEDLVVHQNSIFCTLAECLAVQDSIVPSLMQVSRELPPTLILEL